MGNYTSIILFIPSGEHLTERAEEINAYKFEDGRLFGMNDVNIPH
jgi:hypothetical protein